MIKRILFLGALALAFGAAVRLSTEPVPAVAVSDRSPREAEMPADGPPHWETLWTRPAPLLAAMHLSSDGSVAWVDRRGSVRGLDHEGRSLLQSAPLPGVNRIVATEGGLVLAYARLNPAHASLTLLNRKDGGKRPLTCPVEGAVWNVAASPDGSTAVVGTGQRYVYVFPVTATAKVALTPTAKWRTAGIPESVAVVSAQPLALLGTWQAVDAGVWAFSLDGTPRWQHDEPDPARSYTVCLSRDGTTAVGVSARGPREAEARLHVWDADTGRPLWTEELNGFRPKALVTRQGRFVAVTYVKTHTYRTGDTRERKLALYDRQGRRLWEQGGLFFTPHLVALSADGTRLTVTDGASTLYTLDERGRIVSRLRQPVHPKTGALLTIKDAVATDDGAYLLVLRGDGQISLLKAT